MPFGILLALYLGLPQEPPKPKAEAKQEQKKALDEDKKRSVRDEDETISGDVIEYTYDPAKAKHEIDAGNTYFKRGSFNAAARRYEEATKWQPNSAHAFLKLAQALEKKDDPYRAAQAYRKFLELAPGDRQNKDIRKRVEKLEKEAEK